MSILRNNNRYSKLSLEALGLPPLPERRVEPKEPRLETKPLSQVTLEALAEKARDLSQQIVVRGDRRSLREALISDPRQNLPSAIKMLGEQVVAGEITDDSIRTVAALLRHYNLNEVDQLIQSCNHIERKILLAALKE